MEYHRSETTRTSSQYIKITTFRWINSVIILSVLNPFSNMLDSDALIQTVRTLFMAELIQRPVFQLVDIMGILSRHIFGPRAIDQRRMNLNFMGGTYDIGERYTDITKVLFLTVWFSFYYPLAFFFASVIFVMSYWMDKFCILRSWAQSPKIGISIFNFTAIFFKICLLAYGVSTAYAYLQFPYDNACASGEEFTSDYIGSHEVKLRNGEATSITIESAGEAYQFCSKEIFFKEGSFPPLPSGHEWLDRSQRTFTRAFAWTFVVVLSTVLLTFIYYLSKACIYPLFCSSKKSKADASLIKFSENPEIYGYVPQVKIPGFAFPFLLCSLKDIDNDLVGWKDPDDTSYDSHNLINVMDRGGALQHDEYALFSIVKSWKVEDE